MKFDKRSLLVGVAAVLFVAAAVVGSLTGYRFWSDRQAEQNRSSAMAVAQDTVEELFSYNYDTAEKKLPQVADKLTSDYRDSYMKVIQDQAIPAAKEKKLSVQTVVHATGVISTTRDKATVLVIANQRFSSTDSAQETITSDRLQVELTKQHDNWLISDIKPI
ncbi:h domain protein [Nocardia sp. CDC160]|uniref:h domain protein n=1 Tax=Nocardia sp. CDC160 TaxID=3112166 RepID=UPI002DB623D8|nr:h domain protein [Nocardia sp. CDC160]MEC3913621.1 h domain protein [Nocardia sp. CDC160]